MPTRLKMNAVAVLALAVLFHWVFMFMKHDAELSQIIPFGEDPYDAVGSYADVIGMLITLLSLFRAFRPYRKHPPAASQQRYLLRTQTVVVLMVFITLAADVIAMARHPAMWFGERHELLTVLGGTALATLIVQLLLNSTRSYSQSARGWGRPIAACLLASITLCVYPEQFINFTWTH